MKTIKCIFTEGLNSNERMEDGRMILKKYIKENYEDEQPTLESVSKQSVRIYVERAGSTGVLTVDDGT